MSTEPLAMQVLPSERPGIQDLFTLDLTTSDAWYNLGLELGLSRSTLDRIKSEQSKAHLRKRAMFREWLKVCPAERCTWSHLLQALTKVDPHTAEIVSETITSSLKLVPPKSDQPHTAQFPLVSEGKSEAARLDISTKDFTSTKSLTPSVASKEGSTEDPKKPSRIEFDYSSLMPSEDTTNEGRSPSNQGSSGTRSFSADDFHTASEDESLQLQPFSYQHNVEAMEQRISTSFSAGKDPATKKLLDYINSGNVTAIKLLIEGGEVTPQTRLQHKRIPLMYAAFRGQKMIVDYLLKIEGFNSLTEKDEDGAMTLYFAVSEGYYEVAKVVINQHIRQGLGLDYLVKGTPLIIYPAGKGFSMICELLLENRADSNLKNQDGDTALIVAASRGHKDVVQVLLKFNADIDTISRKTSRTALEEALHYSHTEVTKLLMQASSKAKENNLKLFSCKTREEVSHLIKGGAKVNTRHGDETTPIMIHAQRGSIDLVQELLYHHANVDLQDETGETALIKASACGHTEVVDALIEAGTIMNLKKTNGYTALAVAILNQQHKVVNNLLLAGADPTIKDRNGHSIEELAIATNNQDIIEAIRRSRSTLKQEGQFIDLLSSYLQKDGDIKTARKEDKTEKAMKKEELRKKLPKSSHAPQEEDSTRKKELEKAYERIGVLETRVHDLTLQVTTQIPTDDELSHLGRERLETEYRKIKELKRKTEQYAVEAKQTAQRLSAENFKLREDLSKERHHNELTHKSILRDMEEIVDKNVSLQERNQAKKEVFEQEVAKRARQLALTSTISPHRLGTFNFTRMELKQLIFKHSLRLSHSLVAVGGLPCSGKSTLLHNMLQIKDKEEENICKLPGLSIIEAAVTINPYRSDQNLPWFSAITKEDAGLLMFASCLAQLCAKRNQSLAAATFNEEEVSDAMSAQLSPKFRSPLVDQYLDKAFERLKDLCSKPKCRDHLDSLQHASLAFMNIWDIGINKAVFEIMSLLVRQCSGLVLLNVLSLKDDAIKLNEKLDLQDKSRYPGQYSDRKDDERVMQVQKAITYYVRFINVSNRLPNSTLLIGTHKDSHEGDKESLTKLSAKVKSLVDERVSGVGFAKALHPQMLTINAQLEDDAKKVCATVETMIMQDSRFEKKVPLTWILLRGVLQSIEKMFLQKSELWIYASDCGLQNLEELESWLELFHNCMSIIYSADEAIISLNQNVVIHPFKFVQCLDRLYYAEFYDEFLLKPKLKMHLDLMQKGILTYSFAQEIWPDDTERSSSKHTIQNEKCNFMLRVLKDLKITAKLDLAICEPLDTSATEQLYFIPSLRHYFSHSRPSSESDSLIIAASSVHQAPCDVYSEFLCFVQQQQRIKLLKFVPDQQYDVLHLKWIENEVLEADIRFRLLDFEDHVELTVRPTVMPGIHESHIFALKQRICSVMKTLCVEFFHKVSQFVPTMKYQLCVVSPDCPKGDRVHLVPFQIVGDQSLHNLKCTTCNRQVSLQQSQDRAVWITCAYQGSPHQTVSARDTLSKFELVGIAENLHEYSSSLVTTLGGKLGIQEAEMQSLKQYCTSDDFPLLMLLEWKKRQTVASRPQLAKALVECGLGNLSQKLDPTIGNTSSTTPPLQHRFPLTQSTEDSRITMAVQRIPHERWKELGQGLGLAVEDIQLLTQAKSQDKHVLNDVIQEWLRRNPSEPVHSLTKVLIRMNLHAIAGLLQHSDSDTQWLK